MKIRFLLLMVCCLMVGSFSMHAEVNGSAGANLTWTYDSGTLTISGTGAMDNYTMNGEPWNANKANITSVIIEEGVTTVGNWAFYWYEGLTSIVFPSTLTNIGESAFNSCAYLVKITALPLTKISLANKNSVSAVGAASSKCEVIVPKSVVVDYKNDELWVSSTGRAFDWGNPTIVDGGYLVVAKANNNDYGTVTGTDLYDGASPVTFTATSKGNYTFKNWTDKDGGIISTQTIYTTTPDKDMVLTANFEEGDGGEITVPSGYHTEDYTWLYNYVNANSAAFGIGTTYADFDTWFEKDSPINGVTWYSEPGTPKRITSLLWSPEDEATLQSKLTGTLDVSALDKLVSLICKYNEITELKLPTEIEVLYCWNNQLTEIETESLTKLKQLDCGNNNITALDVTHLASTLIGLTCNHNQLKTLDVKNLTELEHLACYNNQIKELDVKNLTKLAVLDCANNQLKVLETKDLVNLFALNCQSNELQTLEVTNLTELTQLVCYRNEITTLDTKNLTKLTKLYCSRNKLTELTMGSTVIENFQCHMNQIPFSKIPKFEDISKNDYAPQYVIHSGSVHPNQVVDLKAMVVEGYETIVTYGEKEVARLTVDNPSLTIPADWLGEVVLEMTNAGFPQSEEGGKAFTYTLEVTLASSVYHTINLEVADGIEMHNLTAGNHQVAEGGHLQLQFLPEDRSFTADDILFLIDGIETEFKVFGENNYFSYILNPVTQDHTILIALKKYPVTLPETKGVTFDIVAGTHQVAYGEKFNFTMTLDDTIDPEKVHVYANGREILPDALRAVTLTYTIDRVITPVTIVIEGAGETTGNIQAVNGVNITIDNGQLTIGNLNSQAVDVAVYTVAGKNVVSLRALCGSKTISLEPGIYLVKAGNEVYKVSVN